MLNYTETAKKDTCFWGGKILKTFSYIETAKKDTCFGGENTKNLILHRNAIEKEIPPLSTASWCLDFLITKMWCP